MEIISKFDIESYCREKLCKITVSGDELKACCPFHDDKNPSFSINIKTGDFKCHSANCGREGDFFHFYQEIRCINFSTCVTELCNITGVDKKQKMSQHRKPISEADIAKWVSTLREKQGHFERLKGLRGLTTETIIKFQLGWNKKLKRYTIPIRDKDGKLINIRMYSPDLRPKMINLSGYGSPAQLYGSDILKQSTGQPVIITEGEFDRLILEQYGFSSVTGTGGASTWRSEWSTLLKDRDIVILYDNDDAGNKAVHDKVAPAIINQAKSVKIAKLPNGPWKDVSDWHLLAAGKGSWELEDSIFEAEPVDLGSAATPFTIETWWPEFVEKSSPPVPTGIPGLDEILGGGLERGQISLLCAPPGSGKTSIAVDWGLNYAISGQNPVLFWSLEMGKKEIAARIVSLRATLPWAEVLRGQHLVQCTAIFEQFKRAPFAVYTREDFRKIKELEELALQITETYNQPPFVIIDYLQLLARASGGEIRQAVESVSSELTSLATRLDLPILALSSVNRGSYDLIKGNKANLGAMLKMAKESGSLEFDAGVVLGIAHIREEDESPRARKAWIGVAKNRLGGGIGAIPVVFDGLSGRFTEIDLDEMSTMDSKTQESKNRIREEKCKNLILQAIETASISSTSELCDYVKMRKQLVCRCLRELVGSGEIAIESDGSYRKCSNLSN